MMFTLYVCANNCNQAKQGNQLQEHRMQWHDINFEISA